MPKSTKLGLELTNDPSTRFEDWRKSLNGEGDGSAEQPKSNAQLIDEFASSIDTRVKTLEESGGTGGGRVYNQAEEPIEPKEGDVWINGSSSKIYNGTIWLLNGPLFDSSGNAKKAIFPAESQEPGSIAKEIADIKESLENINSKHSDTSDYAEVAGSYMAGNRTVIISDAFSTVGEEIGNLDGRVAKLENGGVEGGIQDAPKDGKYYSRKDGEWVELPPSVTIRTWE